MNHEQSPLPSTAPRASVRLRFGRIPFPSKSAFSLFFRPMGLELGEVRMILKEELCSNGIRTQWKEENVL